MAGAAQAADISGAGATFPYPVYAKWAEAYKAETGINLNYQSIGSGGGIKQIKAQDRRLSAPPTCRSSRRSSTRPAWSSSRLIMGGVVPVVNVDGHQARPDASSTARRSPRIYLGKITSGTTRRSQTLNPELKLPDQAIAPVYRSDGSGTNFLFTDYLAQGEPELQDQGRRQHLGRSGRPASAPRATRASPP